ncbi:hypothetical protein ACN27F_04075 [Solwaraspora sp. WMMB335]|uniref:hypothetical protein n=1 Tax=Solwaraspora sp. WMMB335 TaxID=3404118 RepID=UPI003B930A81
MPRWKTRRLGGGAIAAAVSLSLFASGSSRWGWFVALVVLLPYAVMFLPVRCAEPLWCDGACPYPGSGLLIGCHLHRLDKIERLFGTRPRALTGEPRALTGDARVSTAERAGRATVAVPSTRNLVVPRHVREGLAFVAALLGAASGLLILIGATSPG